MSNILGRLETYLKTRISRASFVKICLGGLAYIVAESAFIKFAFAGGPQSGPRPKKGIKGDFDLVLAEGKDPYNNTVKAVEAMGGMSRFVKPGNTVLVKPNMGWDRNPEQAGNTNPEVIAALIDMCYKAGAKKVNLFDVPCNDEKRVHENSGIAAAAKARGANVTLVNHWNVAAAHFPYESPMEGWPILRDAIDCDVLINVPILKHHVLTLLTISMKNLMGVCSGDRGKMHVDIGRKLVDLTDFMSPDLTVIDATRVLMRHGPSGGDLADVERMDKIIVATDPTLADAFAATLVDRDPLSIPSIEAAAKRGFGSVDIAHSKINRINT